MRGDVFLREVLSKCEALKDARVWLAEPKLRPRAWLNNFDEADRFIAAILLDRFTFYSDNLTERLLISSYSSLGDGLPKGPEAPGRDDLVRDVPNAVFTRVDGERPNPTDSGNLFCRMARQFLGVPDSSFVEPKDAIKSAAAGKPIVFLDDFVGSGDQFVETWERAYSRASPASFAEAMQGSPFTAAYVSLVATDYGLKHVHIRAPKVAVSTAHTLNEQMTYREVRTHPAYAGADLRKQIDQFLSKYAPRLNPPGYVDKVSGYKSRGLMFAFEHSVPDATIPIFWAEGTEPWVPLVPRK